MKFRKIEISLAVGLLCALVWCALEPGFLMSWWGAAFEPLCDGVLTAEGEAAVLTNDKGQKVIVMQPYYQLFVISPVSSYKSDNYSANGMKAEKLRCVSNAVWKDLKPLEVVNLYFDEKKRVSLAASTGVSVELNEVSF